jgi:hypothetical protein
VNVTGDETALHYCVIPEPRALKLTADAAYVHYTANDTIGGGEFSYIPDTGGVPRCESTQCGSGFSNDGFIGGHDINPTLAKLGGEPRGGLKTRERVDDDVAVDLMHKCRVGLQERLGDAFPTSSEARSDVRPHDPEVIRHGREPPIYSASDRAESQEQYTRGGSSDRVRKRCRVAAHMRLVRGGEGGDFRGAFLTIEEMHGLGLNEGTCEFQRLGVTQARKPTRPATHGGGGVGFVDTIDVF